MGKAKYRAARPAQPRVEAAPRRRWLRRSIMVGLLVGYAALMWYVVFPYVDRTFVNQPAVGDDFVVPAPTVTASASP